MESVFYVSLVILRAALPYMWYCLLWAGLKLKTFFFILSGQVDSSPKRWRVNFDLTGKKKVFSLDVFVLSKRKVMQKSRVNNQCYSSFVKPNTWSCFWTLKATAWQLFVPMNDLVIWNRLALFTTITVRHLPHYLSACACVFDISPYERRAKVIKMTPEKHK